MPYFSWKKLKFVKAAVGLILAFVITGGAALSALAQPSEPRYRFDSWTTDNGLPQVSVNSILQTRDGFLWFSTFGGVVRYDGLRFQVFTPGNTKGLRTGRILQLREDAEGNLWMNTEGQGVSRYKDGVFTTYTVENGLPANQLMTLDLDATGTIIAQTDDGQARWDGEKFIPDPPLGDEPHIRPMFRNRTGGKWFFNDSRVQRYDNGKLTVDVPTNLVVARGTEDSNGALWMAAAEKDLLYTVQNGAITTHTAKDGFPEFRLGQILNDIDGTLWLSGVDGLHRYNGKTFDLLNADDGLVRGIINTLYQDREGTIWAGTNGGLSRLTRRAITAYSKKDGLSSDNIYPIIEGRSGRIWIGAWSGLTLYENGVFTNAGERFDVVPELMWSLFEDRNGELWFGTFSGLIPPRSWPGQLPSFLKNVGIRSIYEDSIGNMWFGTNNGLVKYDGRNFTQFTQKEGLPAKTVFVIHEDKNGVMWLGTESGLVTLQDNRFTTVSDVNANIVRSIYEDKDGTLWIGMYDSGIYRIKDGNTTHYTAEQGLFDNGAFKIVEDDAENFWISCNLGIFRVRKAELNDLAEGRIKEVTSVLYNKRDGMLHSECNGGGQNAGIRARDGKIWFPTQDGVAVIDPKTIPINTQPPPVVIESLVIDTQPVPVRASINIEPEQTNLEVHYSGLSFINPELVKFKYKLHGLDHDWIDAGTRRTAYYPHLPPGEYKFTVLAANRDGVWNETGATISINVLPPFWRTWWFLALMTLSIMLLAFLAYRFRVSQLKKAHAAQEVFARRLIDSQEKERKRIAAELHDSLGQSLVLIKNWALLGISGMTTKDPAHPHLAEISSTASEAIQEVREIAYNLGPYQLERLGLSNTIREMVQKAGDASSVKFNNDIGEIDGCLERDVEISFFRIIQEAVSNIVRHSGASEAHIKIRKHQDLITLTIRDDGRGFDADPAKRGFGLLGMQERVSLLRGEMIVRSEIGKGTSIKVTLPCNK